MTKIMHGTQQTIKWKYVILFILIAFLISAPANLGWLSVKLDKFTLPYGLDRFKILIQGIGPFIAGLVLRRLDPDGIDSTPRGKYKNTGWVMVGLSIILLTLVGNPHNNDLNPYYWGV